MKKLLLVLIIFASLSLVSAHQPRLVYQQNLNESNFYTIKNPEVSQAFYAELKGSPEYYVINSPTSFNLYVQILSPADFGDQDFSVRVIKMNSTILLNGEKSTWTKFYEEFAGDTYFQGPEYESPNSQGFYVLKISSSDNLGKYVLVVGKKETFPFKEALNAIVSMPKLKIYFQKSVFLSFFNIIGLFLLVLLILVTGILLLIIFIVKRLGRKFSKKINKKRAIVISRIKKKKRK